MKVSIEIKTTATMIIVSFNPGRQPVVSIGISCFDKKELSCKKENKAVTKS